MHCAALLSQKRPLPVCWCLTAISSKSGGTISVENVLHKTGWFLYTLTRGIMYHDEGHAKRDEPLRNPKKLMLVCRALHITVFEKSTPKNVPLVIQSRFRPNAELSDYCSTTAEIIAV